MTAYYDLEGTHRAQCVEKTLSWLLPKLPQLGITRVANITGLDDIGIHVTASIRPNAKFLSVSQGKGITLSLAKVSAIMESIEGYHAENPPDIDLHGSFQELRKIQPVINPSIFSLGAFTTSLEQYPLNWVRAEELISRTSVYIPHICVCLDSTKARIEYGLFDVTTNGLAAGNTLEEALCHALYEVIERNNLAYLQKLDEAELAQCQLNLESVSSEINQDLLTKLQRRLRVMVWDITGDMGIPTFHSAIWDPQDPKSGRIYTGSGTHFKKDIALSRSLTEAAQARLTLISGMRDDIFPDYYTDSYQSFSQNHAHFFTSGQRHFESTKQPSHTDSFVTNTQLLINKLSEHGYHKIYAVNHTKSEINVPTIQLFVPGLHHDHSRM